MDSDVERALRARIEDMTRADEEKSRQLEEKSRRLEALTLADEEKTRQLQLTTLRELLQFCHTYIDQKFEVEPDTVKTTRGSITSPTGKLCPSLLEPWQNFEDEQAGAFVQLEETLHPTDSNFVRAFSPLSYLKRHGDSWNKKIASELDLTSFQNQMVEKFVVEVSQTLPSAVSFFSTSHALGENSDTVIPPQYPNAALALMHDAKAGKKSLGADQICTFQGEDGTNELLFVEEYKAPHKLTKDVLRAALQNQATINVDEVRNKDYIPTEENAKFLHGAQELVAMAATQTYDYLLRSGCTHGCIVTGESIVFVKVSEADTKTLLYHLTEPTLDAIDQISNEFDHSKTSVARLVSFCLMAFESPPRSQKWMRDAIGLASTWKVDLVEFWDNTPEKVSKMRDKDDRSDTSYRGPTLRFTGRSPYPLRKIKPPKPTTSCKVPSEGPRDDREDPDQDKKGQDNTAARQKPGVTKLPIRKNGQASSSSAAPENHQQRQYCTQACILGLVQRHAIDESCPNAQLHPRGKRGDTHSLTKPVLRDLIRRQLAKSMDEDCQDLHLTGARGMIFKLSLREEGYTFIGKATIDRFTPCLQHEGRVYHRLRRLQGQLIPVCLGNIDLDIPWFGHGIELVHMLLMSYGGECISIQTSRDNFQQEVDFERTIAALGVRHEDLFSRNMLWNKEVGRLLFIDFERSTLSKVRPKLTETPPSKRKIPEHKTIIKRKALQELLPSDGKLNLKARMPKNPAPIGTEKSSSLSKARIQDVPCQRGPRDVGSA
ncbi:MAG: hypothetical protein LQ337_007339 [Flavoplaca oasis]|nr:MAG: hypothetical protein LQ337_007339 [Flavoplaca oasis]